MVKTNENLYRMKQKLDKKEEKNEQIMKQFVEKLMCAIEGDETDENEKTFLEKVKLFFSSIAKKKEDIPKLKKFSQATKRSESKTQKPVKPRKAGQPTDITNEPKETKFEKFKSFFKLCTKKKNNENPRPKKIEFGIKRSKNEIKSLRHYIKQKYKWVISFLLSYIIILGVVVSTPIIIYHLRFMSRNQTKQERSIS